jgi:hypothetical protein
MAEVGASGASNGIAFLVSAGLVYEAIAAACSSPQTMEINAATRGPTLMKWVHLGMGQAAGLVIIATIIDRRHAVAIVSGGLLAGGLMYAQYKHAHAAGMASGLPGTESA